MKRVWPLAFFSLTPLALAACFEKGNETNASLAPPICMQTGITPERVCKISHFQALGSDVYEGRVVRVSGFLADVNVGGQRKRLLFFSREQAEMPNVGGGIGIGDFSHEAKLNRVDAYRRVLETIGDRPIEVIGTLKRNDAIGTAEPTHILVNLVGAKEVVNMNNASAEAE